MYKKEVHVLVFRPVLQHNTIDTRI